MHPSRVTATSAESGKQGELQARLSTVHNELRKEFRVVEAGGGAGADDNWFLTWRVENKDLLVDYSQAMYELATEVWAPRNNSSVDAKAEVKCRIEWVMVKVRQYFVEALSIPGRKLRLLDVGSCYNPFSVHGDILDIVALDLCPAPPFREVVFEADFLSIDCSKELDPPLIANQLPDETRQLSSLSSNYFDFAVFSFFLEYLPDPNQRLESCRRAWKVLRPGGILFILRPDSNSVTPASMKLIKELKVGLAFLGFKRRYCDKLEHLWGMGFMKLTEDERSTYLESARWKADSRKVNFSEDGLHRLFSIPQDSNEIHSISKQEVPPVVMNSPSVHADPLLFTELPGFDV